MKHRKIEIPETALVAMELTALNSQKKKAYREINSIPFILDSIKEELNNIYNLLTDNFKYDKFQTIHSL
jgi:hypothetical protein